MDLNLLVQQIAAKMVGLPLMIFVVAASVICTIALRGVQFTYFFRAWKEALFAKPDTQVTSDMSPLQAFINTLSASIGNGSLAGMATAIYSGGPGAAFWVVIFSILLMAIRFAEVYISALYGAQVQTRSTLGGPMLYLRSVPFGKFLSYLYALLCFIFGLCIGNAMQANSVRVSLAATWQVPSMITAVGVFLFVLYVVCGGAKRIVTVSDKIVPIKVLVFFGAALLLLLYHAAAIIPALKLICTSAVSFYAIKGGALGFSVMQAIRFGMIRSIMATESGLGTAAVLFGFTGSKKPLESALMGMLGTFVSMCVCFLVALCIIVSGVWDSGLTSAALTVASFNTVFGNFGGWIVSFLSITFGIGVMVTYAYITRAAWLFLTNGRWQIVFAGLYSLCAFGGALVDVDALWALGDIVNASMLIINLFGLLFLLPDIARDLYATQQSAE
jgi:AGCS family alanine or glycine:cation symporter